MKKISVRQMNQVLRNIDKSRYGANIRKDKLMSAVAKGCYIGKMPMNEMAKVINFLIAEGYLEIIDNKVYIKFKYYDVHPVFGGYVFWYRPDEYSSLTANIRKNIKEVK